MYQGIMKNKVILILSAIYIITSLPIALYLQNLLHLMLGWNIVLAIIPLLVSIFLVVKYKVFKNWLLIIIFLFWFLFFPNSPYLMTDFIHLQNKVFYDNDFYIRDFKLYVGLLHIVLGCIIGLTLAMKSLYLVHKVLLVSFNKIWAHVIFTSILLLSGFGIFIGRILRFNSWDSFNPMAIINIIKDFDSFALGFSLIFALTIFIIYIIYSSNLNTEEKNWVEGLLKPYGETCVEQL